MKLGLASLLFIAALGLNAQHDSHTQPNTETKKDSTLAQFFRKGSFNGHTRMYFMATDNEAGLTDYHALAYGLGIGYETPRFYGFSVGMSGYFIYNITSSDLAKTDPASGQSNRYELGLFDIENPNNHRDLDRLEDLFIRFGNDKSFVKLGKQHFNTPFINPQDGRMRPTLVEGVYAEWNQWKNWKFSAALLDEISPRSTVRWYSIGNSIGVYPSGVNPDGSKSGYKDHVESDWLALAGISRQVGKSFKIQVWDQVVENVFNTALAQAEWNPVLKKGRPLQAFAGIKYIYQSALNQGGNSDPGRSYFQAGATSQVYSLRIGLENKPRWNVFVSYTEIGPQGRYLMPREWGRDPFYTFMPRERNDGLGGVNALTVQAGRNFVKGKLRTSLGVGHYMLPDVKNTALNKYGQPSYEQVNAEIRFLPEGKLKNLQLFFLYVYKAGSGETYGNAKFVLNKVNMSLFNLMADYHF